MDLLAQYNFEFVYRNGRTNRVADFLARIMHGEDGKNDGEEEALMCMFIMDGNCRTIESKGLQNV